MRRSSPFEDFREASFNLLRARYIKPVAPYIRTACVEPGGFRLDLRDVDIAHRDLISVFEEARCAGEADSPGGAGNYNQRFDVIAHTASAARSEGPTSELQSLMRISYAVFCLNKKT